MADWRALAKSLALADGAIDSKESEIIIKEFMADGVLDRSEVEWLIDVRNSSSSRVDEFDKFVFGALKPMVLADGEVDSVEAAWLRKFIFADGNIDAGEKKFLAEIKAGAKSVCPEFTKLCQDAGV
jgi:tellurite resistance protein